MTAEADVALAATNDRQNRVPAPTEWLINSECCYTAHTTRFAQVVGLISRTTPVSSF
jgi:hypothetical protein